MAESLSPFMLRTPTDDNQNVVDEASMGRSISIMRLMNVGGGILLMILSFVNNLSFPTPAKFIVALYAGFGGLLILLQETQLSFFRVRVAMNFGFLFSPLLRFLYYMLLASMCWSLDSILGKITSSLVGGLAVYNTFILCKYPEYKKCREELAKKEDAKIAERIKEQTFKQMLK